MKLETSDCRLNMLKRALNESKMEKQGKYVFNLC